MSYPKQPGQDADAHRRLAMENLRLLDEVKRLEGEKEILIIACGKAHSVGMEAAAKVAELTDYDDGPSVAGCIRAVAKEHVDEKR